MFEKGNEMTAWSAKPPVPASSLGSLSEIGSGGHGKVYKLSGEAPVLWALPNTGLVYKEYNRSARASLDSDVLDEMAQYAAHLPSGPEGLGDRLAWPLATVERDGAVSGFLMRRAPRQFVVQLRLPSGATQKLAEVQLLLNDKQYLADRGLPVHDRWRLQFLRDTADTLAMLHRCGITVGDLSPKNLLASFTTRPCCFFLDCDTMRMTGRSALPEVETAGWEVQNEERATIASDSYKLALLAVRLFARDQESKDFTALSTRYPELGQLARRGISLDPTGRPTPADWLPALDAATPRATTTLPWERTNSSSGGVKPLTEALISTSPLWGNQWGAEPGFDGETSDEESCESVRRRENFVNEFLKQALRQADLTFYLSAIFLATGGIIILIAATLILARPHGAQFDQTVALSGLIGLIIGTTGATLSIKLDKARKHLADQAVRIHLELDRERRFEHSVKILTNISDKRLGDEARVSVAKRLIDNHKQPNIRES